jgi:hypothetical protein
LDIIYPIAYLAATVHNSTACEKIIHFYTNEQLQQECHRDASSVNLDSSTAGTDCDQCAMCEQYVDPSLAVRSIELRIADNLDNVNSKLADLKARIAKIMNVMVNFITLTTKPGSVILSVQTSNDAKPQNQAEPMMDVITAATEIQSNAQMQTDFAMERSGVTTSLDTAASSYGSSTMAPSREESASTGPGMYIGIAVGIICMTGVVGYAYRRTKVFEDNDLGIAMNDVAYIRNEA